MKKFLSAIFPLLVIVGLCAAVYFNQAYVKRQVVKVKGMYYVFQGDEAFRNHNMGEAIKLYNNGLKLFPGHYSAWYNLGNIYVAYEDYYSALYAYSQAFKYNPKLVTARMNYGIVASKKLGDFDTSIDQYNKILKIKRKLISIPYIFDNKASYKENKAIAYYNMGLTYRLKSLYSNDNWELQRKYLAQAIQAYKKSLEIDSNRYDTWFNLGLAYHISDNYLEAGRCYCQAIHMQPLSYEAHFNLAVLLRRMRHYKESYEEIEKAATLITALDGNSAAQQYVAIVMNDITKNLYQNNEYRASLTDMLNSEKSKIHEEMSEKDLRAKETKKDKDKDSVTSQKYVLVNGKPVLTKNLDKKILKTYGSCSSMEYFAYDENYNY